MADKSDDLNDEINARDKIVGLRTKWDVRRLNDPAGKHANCRTFVLDFEHDKYAIPAAIVYAEACKKEFPELSKDLIRLASESTFNDKL